MKAVSVLVGLLLTSTACASPGSTPQATTSAAASLPSGDHSTTDAATPPCPSGDPTQPLPPPDRVLVFFACEGATDPGDMVAVERRVDPEADKQTRLLVAVTAYLRGPQGAERKHAFSLGTPGALNDVSVKGSRAIIDLDLAAASLDSTTSMQSALLWGHLRALTFQLPGIRTLEPRFNGSCRAFGSALEAGECLLATRTGKFIRQSKASTPLTTPDAQDVDGVQVVVNSHCGVRGVWVKGRLWLASPPLGGHNPPPGWDENETRGVFQVTAPRRGQFHGDGGQTAHFRLPKPGMPDPNEGCE